MPALPDQDPMILAAANQPKARPQHPSPLLDGLALEVMSGKEIGYHGQIFGVDVPYLMVPLGWGELAPLVD
jgi:hypothetical protein